LDFFQPELALGEFGIKLMITKLLKKKDEDAAQCRP
jgi:hypothetical protein